MTCGAYPSGRLMRRIAPSLAALYLLIELIAAGSYCPAILPLPMGRARAGERVGGEGAEPARPSMTHETESGQAMQPEALDGTAETAPVILMPSQEVMLSAEIAGRVARVPRRMGDSVKAGALLIVFDDAIARAEFEKAEAELRVAEAEVERRRALHASRAEVRRAEVVYRAARANREAVEKLHAGKNASLRELEEARRDETIASVDLEVATGEATVRLATALRDRAAAQAAQAVSKQRLEACAVHAPFTGRLTLLHVRPHEWVERGAILARVVADDTLEARFLLPSRYFRALRVGRRLPVRIVETGEVVVVTVERINAEFEPASGTFEVHGRVPNEESRLRAGMNGRLDVTVLKKPASPGASPPKGEAAGDGQ